MNKSAEKKNSGFTMTELIVVLVIIGILAAVVIPSAMHYIRLAKFRENEENAKTVYMGAESMLTYYRTSGQWDSFCETVRAEGILNEDFADGDRRKGRIYAITLDGSAYRTDAANNPVCKLLDPLAYSGDLMAGAIGIEIDIESGEVYSAFYAGGGAGLIYGDESGDGRLSMTFRDYDSRRERGLGYYSVEDVTNVVELEPVRLKVTSVNLVNGETLSLNWSSNSRHQNLDVEFQIKFYDKSDDTELFETTVNLADLAMGAGQTSGMFRLAVKAPDGTEAGYYFPITNNGGKLSLILDGMMSADVMYAIEHAGSSAQEAALARTSSTSITRLGAAAPRLLEEQNIYAAINAVSVYRNMGDDTREYRASNTVTSNTANTLYADQTDRAADGTLRAGIAAFRHLSNIRYSGGVQAEFTLTRRNMDWKSVGTGLYDFGGVQGGVRPLVWKEGSGGCDFPSIPMLCAGQTVEGSGSSTSILNLRLGSRSVAGTEARYLGLFCESEGRIAGLTLKEPRLSVSRNDAQTAQGSGASLWGVGILAGRSAGDMRDITIEAAAGTTILEADLSQGGEALRADTPAAVGGVVGVFARAKADGTLVPTDAVLENIVTNGKLSAVLPASKWQDGADGSEPQYGVGGVCGYAGVTENRHISMCTNHAAVTGSSFTGGIVGQLAGPYETADEWDRLFDGNPAAKSSLYQCSSDGLILCGSNDGRYFGGIAGYVSHALIMEAESAGGRAENFTYDITKSDLLKGDYVGGIAGCGKQSVFYDCFTRKNGYVLGQNYVGGIVGGMRGDHTWRIGGTNVTANAGYVIGNSYVGGIIGENINNKIEDCINNGIAAGYGSYIGGIVGYNDAEEGKTAEILDCASYLSDYNDAIYRMIVDQWQTKGSYVGGLAGYNNSRITFTSASAAVSVKAVSSIVVGKDYVGGMVGFNDVDGVIDTDYTLIGGRIYGYGDCVGGCIGLNASGALMEKAVTIKPYSVTGRYCVGGVIGANVINLSDGEKDVDLTADALYADNPLGLITGEAFCGGVIGYQKNYADVSGRALLSFFENYKTDVIPSLSADSGVPVYTQTAPEAERLSASQGTFTVTSKENDSVHIVRAGNNIPIRANLYTGGIVGYGASGSVLCIENCRNGGNITKTGDSSVIVAEYLAADLKPEQKEQLGNFSVDMIGGMIGVNQKGQTIRHCENAAVMYGFIGNGGIVGLNAGSVYRCALTDHFGSLNLDYVGGIAGVNNGTIENCGTVAGKTISGNNYVGGITGFNLFDGVLRENTCYAGINAAGSYAGGIAGKNAGLIEAGADGGQTARSVAGRNGTAIGGLVGLNDEAGVIRCPDRGAVTVVNDTVTVIGKQSVGGMVGINAGTIMSDGAVMTVKARLVQALEGDAGGIAGKSDTAVRNMNNASERVTADRGNAGGIVAVNVGIIEQCTNNGNVSSSQGNAGGIAAANESAGIIRGCLVADARAVNLRGVGAEAAGAVCAFNEGVIENSAAAGQVTLGGSAGVYGGVAGINRGTIQGTDRDLFAVKSMPQIASSEAGRLTVGGVAGINEENAVIRGLAVEVDFLKFSNYQYLGGVAGVNAQGGTVAGCTYAGTMTDTASLAGNCYGGIAGDNGGTLEDCRVDRLSMTVKGVYTATSNSTAAQKEALSSHVGGIAGKNEESGGIIRCYLVNSAESKMIADSGMSGGVTGYNKGLIRNSGDAVTAQVMAQITEESTTDELCAAAAGSGIAAVSDYVNTQDNRDIEAQRYSGQGSVSAGKMQMRMEQNGNVGGITAYNAPTGTLEYCVSGNWFINNKSNAIGVGTGGMIGMNESEKDLKYLVNGAFVGRQLGTGATNRFAGGIIGNQSNSTKSGWTIRNCVNYGTVYCYNAHYSGGIMGQWTGTGGNIESCRNYATLQTSYQAGWTGAAAGIVAQLYHADSGDTFNIISCGNYGSIYGRNGAFSGEGKAANDSAGILGNVTTYKVSNNTGDYQKGQQFTIQVLDCVNAAGVSIYSSSMASGMVGFFSCDNPTDNAIVASTQNVILRIERCRNFAENLYGYRYVGGIFGDRYGRIGAQNTYIKDCFSVSSDNYRRNGASKWQNPVVSMEKENNTDGVQGSENYFFGNGVGYTNLTLYGNRNGNGSSYTYNGNSVNSLDNLRRGGGNLIYLVYDGTKKQYAAAALRDGAQLNRNCRIDGTDITSGGTKIGEVLCYLGTAKYDSAAAVTKIPCDYYELVRGSYRHRNIEGMYTVTAEDGKTADKLIAPASVTASVEDGRVLFSVTPASDGGKEFDPFCYEVRITVGDAVYEGFYFYTESGSLELPEAISGGAVRVAVRAVSMYGDVLPSDYREAGDVAADIMPTPDIRATLVWDDAAGDYRYRFTLNNLETYRQNYPGWQVLITFSDGTAAVLNESQTGALAAGRGTDVQQLIVQAIMQNGGTDAGILPSARASVAAYLPSYAPSVALQGNGTKAVPYVEVAGTTLSDLRVSVTLDGTGTGNIDVPPVYRAELTGTFRAGTDEEKRDVVFASADILVAADGTATANFTDFSENLREASEFQVRLWYAESGLGPVYGWFALDGPDTEGLGELITAFDGLDESGQAVYRYSASPVLFGGSRTAFDNYKWYSGELFAFFPAPELMEIPTDAAGGEVSLTPEFGPDGTLRYTFSWDAEKTGDEYRHAKYRVALTGINAAGERVVIDTSSVYDEDGGARSLTVDAESWDYERVELSVTRIGDAAERRIGLNAVNTYRVKRRLRQPGQPVISLTGSNDLRYIVAWAAQDGEKGCIAYRIYAKYTDDAGNEVTEQLGEVKAEGAATYEKEVDLEAFAGKNIAVYLEAIAGDDSAEYVDSRPGDGYTLEVPSRIPTPQVEWKWSWTYDRTAPVGKTAFETGDETDGLTVGFTADAASIPPGGSTYLLRARIYDSDDADAEPVAYYPAADDAEAVVEMTAASGAEYRHTLAGLSAAYAGNYICFDIRITSGNGQISSKWKESERIRLPYVRLEQPGVQSLIERQPFYMGVTDNPDLPAEQKEWQADRQTIVWSDVAYADTVYLTLTGRGAGAASVNYRVVKTEDAAMAVGYRLEVQEKVTLDDGTERWFALAGTAGEEEQLLGTWRFPLGQTAAEPLPEHVSLQGYGYEVSGEYTRDGIWYGYRTMLYAELRAFWQDDGFSYVLALPDNYEILDETGYDVEAQKEYHLTGTVSFTSDRLENAGDTVSDAYVESEEYVMVINQ